MKKIYFLILCGAFAACSSNSCEDAYYDRDMEAKQGSEFCFEDGNELRVVEVNDQLCPCGANCLTAGHVGLVLEGSFDGRSVSGEISIDAIIDSDFPELELPPNFKIEVRDQYPVSGTICGGQVAPKDFTFTLFVQKQ